jgi:hypothetical protein
MSIRKPRACTAKQKIVMYYLRHGAVIRAHVNDKGDLCFLSDHDGLRGALYLTLTCRALVRKKLINIENNTCTNARTGAL